MAKGGVAIRGRTLVAILLGVFVVVALSIVWRRTMGIEQSERLAGLDARRAALESERAHLESEIRDASTRQKLGESVERKLGMRIPSENQVVILTRARPDETP